jgi:hypothetical protein
MRTRGGIRSRDESELDQAEASLPEKRPLSAECLNPNMRQGYVQQLLHSAVRMQPWQRSSWHVRCERLSEACTQQQAPLAPAISAQSAKQLLPRLFLLPLPPQRNKEPPIIAVAAFNPPVPSCLALQFSSALPFISAAVSELEDGSWFMDGIGLDQTQ